MSSLNCKNSVTPAIGFVDIATLSELEAYLYGGQQAITYFVRSVLKANWFTFVATALRHVSGCADFGNDFSASVNRSGDYVLNVWLRVQVPQIAGQILTANDVPNGFWFAWTHNFGHNLIKYCNITFNELKVHEFDSTWLDFWAAYNVTASKRIGYDNMIGNVSAMTNFVQVIAGAAVNPTIPTTGVNILGTGGFFNIPLPFFFSADSGIALPVAAIPFNDIKINYCLRDWKDMIVVARKTSTGIFYPASDSERTTVLNSIYTITSTHTNGIPAYSWGTQGVKLQHCETLSHYVVVHNDERVLMGKCSRDMAMHQVQFLQDQQFDLTKTQQCFDLRFSHSVTMVFYAAKNVSWAGEHSQYSVWDYGTNPVADPISPDITGLNGFDPIEKTQLIYENTARFDGGSDYGALVVPWYFGRVIPEVSGLHVLSYTLEMFSLDPKGSTGYSKLANVSIIHHRSDAAYQASVISGNFANTTNPVVAVPQQNNYKNKVLCDNWNIIRISGGSLGLPVL